MSGAGRRSFRLGCNEEALFLVARVRDRHPRLPKVWPGVAGSCLELFFDFRTPAEGLGRAAYGKQVFQLLIRPPVEKGMPPELWSPQRPELSGKLLRLEGGCLAEGGYWITLALPWKLVVSGGVRPERFGFDAGINGSFADRAERKAQLMLFGTDQNFRNASKFGTVLTGKEPTVK